MRFLVRESVRAFYPKAAKPAKAVYYMYHMPTLYMRPSCGHCRTVLEAGNRLGVVFNLKNIENPDYARELVERGGKTRVPFLYDEGQGVQTYGSEEIVAYLEKRYV